MEEILAAAETAGIDQKKAKNIAEQVRECVYAHLRQYLK